MMGPVFWPAGENVGQNALRFLPGENDNENESYYNSVLHNIVH